MGGVPSAGGNSWSVVTDKTFFNRNIPQECHDKMKEFAAAGHQPRLVAFPKLGGNRWSVLGHSVFFNRNVPDECHMILGELYAGHGPIRCLAYDADGNGWSVVSAAKPAVVYRLPFEDDDAWQLAKGNLDDPGGGHGAGQKFAFDFTHAVGGRLWAARGGKVIFVENNDGNTQVDPTVPGYGTAVLIRHSDNTVSAYDHPKFNSPVVSVGDTVPRGQLIGLFGNTGNSFSPHVHFEVVEFWNGHNDSGPSKKIHFESKDQAQLMPSESCITPCWLMSTAPLLRHRCCGTVAAAPWALRSTRRAAWPDVPELRVRPGHGHTATPGVTFLIPAVL